MSQKVYAVVQDTYEYNDEIFMKGDGYNVRAIFVNRRDAEESLKELTIQELEDVDFSQYAYSLVELVDDLDEFCELANEKFGHIFTLDSKTLDTDELTGLFHTLNVSQKLEFIKLLRFSCGQVLPYELQGVNDE